MNPEISPSRALGLAACHGRDFPQLTKKTNLTPPHRYGRFLSAGFKLTRALLFVGFLPAFVARADTTNTIYTELTDQSLKLSRTDGVTISSNGDAES